MAQFYAIMTNAFWEAVRQPAYGLILIIASLMILLAPLSGAQIYTLSIDSGAGASSVAEMGLSTMLIAGLLLTVFTASGVINREIEEKTALTVLTKFIGRFTFIIGKFGGVVLAVTIAVLSWSMLIMLTIRFGSAVAAWEQIDYGAMMGVFCAVVVGLLIATWRNYFSGKSWTGNFSLGFFGALAMVFAILFFIDADYQWAFGDGKFGAYNWQVGLAALLSLEAILILAGLAVAFSARCRAAANFSWCFLFFVGGLTIDFFYVNYGSGDSLLAMAIRLARVIFPALQAFWMSEALKYQMTIPWSYFIHCSLYAGAYIGAALCGAAFLFERREIE